MMIAITKLKIDNRGRITLPDNFLKANGIKKESFVEIYPVYNREDSIRLQFVWEGKDDKENR
tara:strand:- start:134 stop:319 length:186 start_codon:yes stop_codon:yes gene_type:complete